MSTDAAYQRRYRKKNGPHPLANEYNRLCRARKFRRGICYDCPLKRVRGRRRCKACLERHSNRTLLAAKRKRMSYGIGRVFRRSVSP